MRWLKNRKRYVAFMIAFVAAGPCAAAILPAGFAEELVTKDFSAPVTAMAVAPDGRVFVAEQTGKLRIVKNGILLPAPFLSLTVHSAGERGLLGIAFDPEFETNQFVYLYYTQPTPSPHNVISRFTAQGDGVVSGSEQVLFQLPNLTANIHNGGALHFGLDGKLYVAVGENGVTSNAQSMTTPLGKMLRLNRDGTIPADNPFFNSTSGPNRAIWALGLRNPFTFAIQKGTGRIHINDVGQNTYEEINEGVAGANYGWPTTEGPTSDPRFRAPIFFYTHASGGCAITGGVFYEGSSFPAEYNGDYLFADYCGGWIRVRDAITGSVRDFATGLISPVDLKIDRSGSLYVLSRTSTGGSLTKISAAVSGPVHIVQSPQSLTLAPGQKATFTCAASGEPPISYQWQKNSVDLSGAVGPKLEFIVNLSDNGSRYRCRASNSTSQDESAEALLTVLDNRPPQPSITSPPAGRRFIPGEKFYFSGSAMDEEDGSLPASSFTWRVDLHHDSHVHPFVTETTGVKSGQFMIPKFGELSRSVFYRIYLTVRDSTGLQQTVTRDLTPQALDVPETLEIENANIKTTGSGYPQGWFLSDNGEVADRFYFPTSGEYEFVVRARGTALGGIWPQLLLKIDGVAGPHVFINSATEREYVLRARVTSGVHRIALRFTNNAQNASEDRNLWLNRVLIRASVAQKFRVDVNFQPASVMVPRFFEADSGELYGLRDNGLTYGWNLVSETRAVDRERRSDQQFDTFISTQGSEGPGIWEIQVPNGSYSVQVTAGDPAQFDSVYQYRVEGVMAVNGTPTSTSRFVTNTVNVNVTDGRITISNGVGALKNKLCFVRVQQL